MFYRKSSSADQTCRGGFFSSHRVSSVRWFCPYNSQSVHYRVVFPMFSAHNLFHFDFTQFSVWFPPRRFHCDFIIIVIIVTKTVYFLTVWCFAGKRRRPRSRHLMTPAILDESHGGNALFTCNTHTLTNVRINSHTRTHYNNKKSSLNRLGQ